ncbi:MAG: helix-turn-helix domain-containing protein [gamma proteobacterium symbiont of Clathrolucina costata]
MAELSADTKRKYTIIAAIAKHNTPTLADISQHTGIPVSSLKRQISQLRTDYGMDIRFVPGGHNKGRTGHYHIYDWGVLDRTEFLVRYGSILEK